MAKVGWSAGIDYVSGALSKPSKNGQHSCQKMLLGTHRVAATTNPNCNRIYLEEDLSKVDADQAAFIAQKDQANGKKTMNAYLWSLETATYDAAHPRG